MIDDGVLRRELTVSLHCIAMELISLAHGVRRGGVRAGGRGASWSCHHCVSRHGPMILISLQCSVVMLLVYGKEHYHQL